MLRRIEDLLARRRAPLWLGLLAVLLCLPALPFGLQADDHTFAYRLQNGVAPPWAVFEWSAHGGLANLREIGALVWWSNPETEANFLRPLTSLSHALDFHLWPRAAWLMRLFNALLYGASAVLAALLYRRLAATPATAALAALIFVIDDGHAVSTSWISARNTLLALTLSLFALWLHVHSRTPNRPWLRLASTCAVGLSLLCSETGLWSVALLVSFALCYEAGSVLQRLKRVVAPLLLSTLWAATYVTLGYGFRGSSLYRDLSAPWSALVQGTLDLPVWVTAQFGPGVGVFPYLAPLGWVRLACLPVAALLVWWLLPSLRRSRECRFFALAFVLCLGPLLFTVPSTRVLLGPSFGAMGWIACSIQEGRASDRRRERWGAGVLVACHVWLAGLLFVPTSRNALEPMAYGARTLRDSIDTAKDVVLVGSPFELLGNYTLASMGSDPDFEPPGSLHTLYSGGSSLSVERVDARTLDIEPERGWGAAVFERIFCAPETMPTAGSEVVTPAFTARVLTRNASGMPQRVRFVFPSPLESPGRQWLTWKGARPVRWTPPAVGESVRLAAMPFGEAFTP